MGPATAGRLSRSAPSLAARPAHRRKPRRTHPSTCLPCRSRALAPRQSQPSALRRSHQPSPPPAPKGWCLWPAACLEPATLHWKSSPAVAWQRPTPPAPAAGSHPAPDARPPPPGPSAPAAPGGASHSPGGSRPRCESQVPAAMQHSAAHGLGFAGHATTPPRRRPGRNGAAPQDAAAAADPAPGAPPPYPEHRADRPAPARFAPGRGAGAARARRDHRDVDRRSTADPSARHW